MNIEYLKYFAELAKLQHYGKAAKALNISQPGLSHAIKTLEDEYGVPLFQKEGRKREPEPLRKRIDAGCRGDSGRISSNGGAGGRPSDGRKDSADRNRISARGRNNTTYAAGIRRDLPVYHLQPPDPRDRGGSAGWKIRYRLLLRTAEIRRTRILSLRESYIAAAVPEGHPLEGKENITLKEAAKYPQVMFSRTSGFRSLQEQIFAEQGIQVKPVCEAEEIEVITGLVENGFGISILPYMDIVRLHHITAIPVQTSKLEIKILHRQEENTESAQRRKRRFFSIGGNDGQEILWYSKTKSK